MNQYRLIDDNGFFLEDCVLEAIPTLEDGTLDTHYIETPCPEGFYHPKWDGGKWVEGLTQDQIDVIKAQSTPAEPTIEERIEALELLELERLFGGAL